MKSNSVTKEARNADDSRDAVVHNHDNGSYLVQVTGSAFMRKLILVNMRSIRHGVTINAAGGGQPHNYIALHFCQKKR